jgi:ComF family protein
MSVSVTESRFLCRLCSAGTYAFERARSVAIYDDVAQRAIVLLKHHEVTRLGEWFAGRLAEMIKRHPEEFDMDVVVPVPLHRARHRARGYNQAELIAKPLARRLNLPCEPDLLVRTKPRPRKLVLSRKERWKSVRGAYEAATPAKVNERRVLVVDDAFTTGATIDACARALKKVGAAGVIGITFARTIFRAS